MTVIVVVAACMIVVGVVFLWLLLRGSDSQKPRGGMEWAGSVMSVLLILCAGFLMALALAHTETKVMTQSGVDQPASDIAFKLLPNDAPQRLSDYEGRVVLLNFWATWCQPCVTELPELDRLQADYFDQGLTVITLSDESREELDIFADLWPERTVSGYFLPEVAPEPYRSELERGRPVSYVIDRDGIVRQFIVGAGNYDSFERHVRPYI